MSVGDGLAGRCRRRSSRSPDPHPSMTQAGREHGRGRRRSDVRQTTSAASVAAASSPQKEPACEVFRQPGDLDRARRPLDVVADPVIGRLPALGVELEPRRPRVAVAGLPDAAGVDQPPSLVDLEAGPGPGLPAAGLAAVVVAVGGREEQGDVRMADEADPLLLDGEAVGRLLGPEDVFPDRIAWRGVVERRRARGVGGGEAGQEVEVPLRGVIGRPLDGRRGGRTRRSTCRARRGRRGRGCRPGRPRSDRGRARRRDRGRLRSRSRRRGTSAPRRRPRRCRGGPPRRPG